MNAIATIQPITEARLQSLAPSIFAEAPHHSRSTNYGYVNTIALIRALVERGFDVTDAQQSRTKDQSRRGFTKHVVRLRHTASYAALKSTLAERRDAGSSGFIRGTDVALGLGVSSEVVLTNSHDGTSAVILHAGLLRAACFNGLIVADSCIQSIHVTHSKRLVEGVIDGAFAISEQVPRAIDAVSSWSRLQLTPAEELAYAKAAHVARFDGSPTTTVEPQQLLRARRHADTGRDLWTTFNRVQENAVRGGLDDFRPAKVVTEDNGAQRRVPARALKTRPIKSIDGSVGLNKALWTLAEELAKTKAAA